MRRFRVFVEDLVEAAAGGKHPQSVVEHEERFGKGVDDRQRQGLGVGKIIELLHGFAPSGGSMSSLSATDAPRQGPVMAHHTMFGLSN